MHQDECSGKSILIAESIQFNAPRSKSIICMQAESVCSLPHSAPVITLTQGLSRVKEVSGELNDPYLPTGRQQWLNWLLQSLHDPTCPAERERKNERTKEREKERRKESSCELRPCLCLSWLSAWFPLRWAQICNETVRVPSNVK